MRSILFVEDDETLRESVADYLRMRFRVFEAADGMSALSVLSSNPEIELIISDQRLPKLDGLALLDKLRQRGEQIPFIMITAFGSVQSAVEAMRLGADDFIQKPFSVNELDRAIEKVFQFKDQKLVKLNELRIPIITQNQKMINILKICEVVAKSDCTVLIEGESGVGKEVIAKTIHSLSHRRNGPCIAINCGAIPEHLLESELFGFEKGAFTGADRKKIGKIELAHNGTLILDEISELPLPLQVKLLRVLQERTIER
ncbi:MAG: sigma-54 dependent transcriptional regulator, partial [Deltaproteobacteria bacterium]|nr:sigma-54 dependent transcriptional regulator [Deltaproteobacteria bacterium]